MGLSFLLFFVLSAFAQREDLIIGNSKDTKDLSVVNSKIDEIRSHLKYLSTVERTEQVLLQECDDYTNLGFLLQLKDVRWHLGRDLKPEALECFNRALGILNSLDEPKVSVLITINHRKGMLLKMMGRGEEAVATHEMVIELASATFDKAASIYHKAEALGMLGKVENAIDCYRDAIALRPDLIAYYLPLVRSLREQNKMSTKQWKKLITEMNKALKKIKKLENKEIEELQTSVLLSFEMSGATTVRYGSEIYWALFEVIKYFSSVIFHKNINDYLYICVYIIFS